MNARPHLPAAVLFDMDGTLIDSEHLWFAAECAVMEGYDAAWTVEDQQACLGGPLDRAGDYMASRIDPARGVPTSVVMAELLDAMDALLRAEPVRWQPGARELLAEANALALPTALVTASWRRLINAVHDVIAADLGRDPFTVMVGGDEVGNGKPHPEPYLRAASLLGVDPADCLVIEDSPTGVASGAAAGCRVVAVPHMAPITPDARVRVEPTLAGRTVAGLWSAEPSLEVLAHP